MVQLHPALESLVGQGAIRPGRVVRHRETGLRALVVERDPRCAGNEAWYGARARRPRRDQPWFHVLVHGSANVGYVAEEDLEPELLPVPVTHPLVLLYFRAFDAQGYRRNDRPWPSLGGERGIR
jgi:heat shock protein HspQ